MTRLEVFRRLLEKGVVDGDKQPGYRWLSKRGDPKKLTIWPFAAKVLRMRARARREKGS